MLTPELRLLGSEATNVCDAIVLDSLPH